MLAPPLQVEVLLAPALSLHIFEDRVGWGHGMSSLPGYAPEELDELDGLQQLCLLGFLVSVQLRGIVRVGLLVEPRPPFPTSWLNG